MTREEIEKLLDGTTPGPWEACGDGRRVKPSPVGLFFAPIAETYQAIRWVDGCWQHEGGEIANARLIAAAPDLARLCLSLMDQLAEARKQVEALREALESYRNTLCEGFCEEDTWCDDGHHHPDIQRDCGGCLAASAILKAAARAAAEGAKP